MALQPGFDTSKESAGEYRFQNYEMMLAHAAKRFTPATVIDVGASNGNWSSMARKVWPMSRFVLVEGNPLFSDSLDDFCKRDGNSEYMIALAGAVDGQTHAHFHNDQPYQGIDIVHAQDEPIAQVRALDGLLGRVPGPYFLKLDVHGHEAMIFDGARELLQSTAAIAVEAYFWQPAAHAPLFHELVGILARYGFRPTDLCDPLYRPSDDRCSQIDMLFERCDAAGMSGGWAK